MALLKLVASHLDLETSLFCPVSVDWPMVRQLTQSAGDKCPYSLVQDARVAQQIRTERAMKAAGLCYSNTKTGEQVPWLEDKVSDNLATDPRKKNSLCRVTICMCLDWHRRHRRAAAYVIRGKHNTGPVPFFQPQPGTHHGWGDPPHFAFFQRRRGSQVQRLILRHALCTRNKRSVAPARARRLEKLRTCVLRV